jgi:hypothetical protein
MVFCTGRYLTLRLVQQSVILATLAIAALVPDLLLVKVKS